MQSRPLRTWAFDGFASECPSLANNESLVDLSRGLLNDLGRLWSDLKVLIERSPQSIAERVARPGDLRYHQISTASAVMGDVDAAARAAVMYEQETAARDVFAAGNKRPLEGGSTQKDPKVHSPPALLPSCNARTGVDDGRQSGASGASVLCEC